MPGFLNGHVKGRNRSVQLDTMKMSPTHVRLGSMTGPSIAERTSSLPSQENQVPHVQSYRSMLVVDTPQLAPHKPILFDELSLDNIAGTWRYTCSAAELWLLRMLMSLPILMEIV
ncbi:hypothetical protein F5Y17DRAFT_429593, partial [Xylariaceae sp. FL0594]